MQSSTPGSATVGSPFNSPWKTTTTPGSDTGPVLCRRPVVSSPPPSYSVDEALKKEGLSRADYDEIVRRLGRAPNRAELGMFGVMWSEHCCYRNSRPLLRQFPTEGPRILVGPGENAGVVDLGEGQRLAFKIESHNHPSAVEPFQGAATGVGGILRDIFTMGARPIALLNALRFGPLEDPRNVGLMEGVVAGIAHYGNCVGVPTVGGEVAFDPSYSGNPLVNAMALGLMETEEIVCSGARGVGYPVVYVGNTTGVIIAAVLLTLLPEGLRMLAGAPVSLPFSAPFNNLKWIAETRMIIYSLLVIVLMLARPQGLFTWSNRSAANRS